jgi:predicted permease
METLLRDIRFGLRQLVRHRSFSVAALLALTLGIGATSAMFSVVDAVLLNELPYKDPDRLVVITGTADEEGETVDWPISQMDFDDIREQSRSFADMSVYTNLAYNLESGEAQESERLEGELVSASYFGLLGVVPAVGRFFSPEEDREPFEDYVVVLGHHVWTRRFGSDPALVGSLLDLNGERYRVIGVGPAGFRGLTDKADLWIPSKLPPKPFYLTNRRLRWMTVVARLQPGTSRDQAQEELTRLASHLAREYPEMNTGIGMRATDLREHWFGELRRGLILLTVGACLLLLIACINVANLLLTRAMADQRAHAIRMALGADRKRLLRQLITQSILLSLIGATLGLLLAWWGTPALIAASGVELQSFLQISAGPTVIAAILGIALLCGIVFGMVPVWITYQTNLSDSLTRAGYQPRRGLGRQAFQNAVVVAQVALALILSTAAGLMARDFQKTLSQNLGFQPGGVLTFRIDMRGPAYAENEPVIQLVRTYLDRLATVPGVASVEIAGPTLPTDGWTGAYFTFEDHASDAPDGTYPAVGHSVSPGYFELLGVPLLQGSGFTLQDGEAYGVIVSRSLADEHWPGQSPLGKRLKNGTRDDGKPWLPVQGVVADVRHQGFQGDEQPAPDLYLPILRHPWRPLNVGFLVRPAEGVAPQGLINALRQEMKAIAPDLPMYDVATLEERLVQQTDKSRFQILLISLFTVVALVMAAVGIYGVVAFSVAQRTREIAIRMSLGADRGRILRMVVGRGALLAGIGLALGLTAILLLSRQLVSLLHETSATDPLVLGGTTLVLFLVTLAANYFPARRAARLEPLTGLRTD